MFIGTLNVIFAKGKKYFLYFPIIVIFFGFVLGLVVGVNYNFNLAYPSFLFVLAFLTFVIALFVRVRWLFACFLLFSSILLGLGILSVSGKSLDKLRSQAELVSLGENFDSYGSD